MTKHLLVALAAALAVLWVPGCSGTDGPGPGLDLPAIDTGRDLGPQPDLGPKDVPPDRPPEDPGTPDDGPEDPGPTPDPGPGDDLPPDGGDVPVQPDVPAGPGKVEAAPNIIDFSYVQGGQSQTLRTYVKNVGSGPLKVNSLTLKTPGPFSLQVGVEPTTATQALVYTFQPAKVLEPGEKFPVEIRFAPTVEGEMKAEIRVATDDASAPAGGAPVYLIGNKKRPCAILKPDSVDWGPVVVGESSAKTIRLESCGQLDLSVQEISLDAAATTAGWVLELASPPSPGAPLVMAPGQALDLVLRFAPSQPGPVGPDGLPRPSTGQLAVRGNSFYGGVYGALTATAAAKRCANAVASLVEAGPVAMGTQLHVNGGGSQSSFGAIATWHWSVDQPAGSDGLFLPSADAPDATFVAVTPGAYTLKLDVTDTAGNGSCETALLPISVSAASSPDKQGAFVVLTWTPKAGGTPDLGARGPDVDLHVLHPSAGGLGSNNDDLCPKDGMPDPWYDDPWDCFWYNPATKDDGWGSPSPWIDDGVELTSSSEDGLGAEVVRLGLQCSPGRTYRIGAHLFDDHGFPGVAATLQVYVNGTQVLKVQKDLAPLDLWDAATLTCGSNAVQGVGNVVPNCTNVSFTLP